MKSWPKVQLGQVEVGSNIAQITYLAHRKSYLVSICHNSHEKLTKSEIMSKLESVRTLLIITRLAYRKSYLAIIGPESHEKLTKYGIRSSYYLFQFGFI